MPLYRHNGAFYFFAHVPKCGGRSVERYLNARWGSAAFLDEGYFGKLPQHRWLRASPQHVTWDDFRRVFQESWISASFAVVRHPMARLVSEYNYLSRARQVLPPNMDFASWLTELRHLFVHQRFAYDNHIRPQCDFVPENARVFRVEDGLNKMVPYIDELSGDKNEPRQIGHLHQTDDHTERATRQEAVNESVAAEFVERFYRCDLDRFGYDTTAPEGLVVHVPTVPATTFQPPINRSRFLRKLARRRKRYPTIGEN